MKNKDIFSNFFWRFFERVGAQGVTFIVSIILARLLDPDVYGVVALITVFTSVMQVFIDSGLGNALIQKKDSDIVDFSTVFYFNICMCLFLYIFLFWGAPYISLFYKMPDLTPLIRVLGINLIISGVKNVQQAYVSKHLLFKRFFYATIIGTIGAAFIGVLMARNGYGVWALVVQNVFNAFLDTCVLWVTVKWRPKLVFSLSRLKSLLSFGWKLLVSSLLEVVYRDLRQLIIGKFYNVDDLAFYNRGQQMPHLLVSNINSSIDSVLLPTMSASQDDKEVIKSMTRRAIKVSTYLMAPLMIGLASVSEPAVKLILTDKWLPSVFYLRIFCISFMFYPIHTANLNAIKAMGRSDLFLKLEIAKKIIGLIVLFATMRISVEAMAYSLLFTSIINQIINSYPNKALLNYSYLNQLKDILPSVLLAIIMGAIVFPITFIGLPALVVIIFQIMLGMIVYIVGSKYFHIDSYDYLLNLIRSYLHK